MTDDARFVHPQNRGRGNNAPVNWGAMPVEQQLEFLRTQLNDLKEELVDLKRALHQRSDGTIVLKKNMEVDTGVDIVMRDA